MKKTVIQRRLALPLAIVFAALLLVCALGFTADAHAASDGTRPLTITSSDPAASFTVSWAGYSADYTPGMAVPMLLPVTITCTNRTVSGWDLAGGWGGADAVLLPAGNSATLSAAAHDSGSINVHVTVSADADANADADADWDGSASDGSGYHGSGSEGSGTDGSGLPGSGSEGSGSEGSGNNGSGTNGSGINGSGNNGSGNNGSGASGSGLNGSGNNGSGVNGSGINGSGNNGSGINGSGEKGSDKENAPTPQNGGNRGTTTTGSGAKTNDSRMVLGIVAIVLLSAAVFSLTYRSWRRHES